MANEDNTTNTSSHIFAKAALCVLTAIAIAAAAMLWAEKESESMVDKYSSAQWSEYNHPASRYMR